MWGIPAYAAQYWVLITAKTSSLQTLRNKCQFASKINSCELQKDTLRLINNNLTSWDSDVNTYVQTNDALLYNSLATWNNSLIWVKVSKMADKTLTHNETNAMSAAVLKFYLLANTPISIHSPSPEVSNDHSLPAPLLKGTSQTRELLFQR